MKRNNIKERIEATLEEFEDILTWLRKHKNTYVSLDITELETIMILFKDTLKELK